MSHEAADGARGEAAPEAGAARPSRRYVTVVLGALALALAVVVGLNLLLGERGQGSPRVLRAASEWQNTSRGVTYAPPVTDTRPFKILRLADRLADINAVMTGSSTAMGVTAAMFPPGVHLYNFTLGGNSTPAVVAESSYIQQRHGGRVQWIFPVLDWSVGGLYMAAPAVVVDLSPPAALRTAAREPVPLARRLEDALTLPKVKNLGAILRQVAVSGRPAAAFREAFLQDASDAYPCPDGTPARDFDVVNRGDCSGYRYDGSWTYYGQRRLRDAEIAPRALAAVAPSSKYAVSLIAARGEPYRPFLEELAQVAKGLRGKGGRLVPMLPPLIPGMEKAFLASPETRAYLERTKAVLERWARDNGIVVIDAGESELYGCTGPEFTDEHHAAPECFAKVMARFWQDWGRDGLPPGLYRPAVTR